MSYAMLHGLGDCTPERHCGCLTMTPERIVGAAIEDETLTRTGRILGDLASEHVANAALDAVRGALASSDPEMATRLGLVRIAGPGSNGRTWETYGTPWQEVPDGDA